MRAYGGLVLLLHAFLTPSVNGGQRSVSRPAGGGERKDPPMLLSKRLVWLEQSLYICEQSVALPEVFILQHRVCTDWTTAAQSLCLSAQHYCVADMARNHVGWAFMKSFVALTHNRLCRKGLINKWHNCGHRWLQFVRKLWQSLTTDNSTLSGTLAGITHEATAAFSL